MTLIQSAPVKNRIPSATLSVNELIKLDQGIMLHKILNEQCPEILERKFTKKFQVSNHENRRVNDLQVLKLLRLRLEITRMSFL